MSARLTPLLILLTCLLTVLGFSLPWAVSAWQDRQTADQVALYQTTPLAQADLMEHLKLAANGYRTVALSQANAAYLSTYQAQEAAQAALNTMYEKGLFFLGQEELFAPEQWTPSAAVPFVAVSSGALSPFEGITVTPQRAVRLGETTPAPDPAAAVVFWRCTFCNGQGAWLDLILDDTFRKMLAFGYRIPLSQTGEAFTFSLEDVQRMAAFCQSYYAIDPDRFIQPESHAPLGYLFPFLDSQGEAVNLNLTSSRTYLANEEADFLFFSFNSRGL